MNTQENASKMLPFARSKQYLLQKAQANRKDGQILDALTLYYRAYEQAKEAYILLHCASVLTDMEAYELSNRILYRALAYDSGLSDAFYMLARNYYYMGCRLECLDSAANYLKASPDGLYVNEAQSFMENAAESEVRPLGMRYGKLYKLAMSAQKAGNRSLAFSRHVRFIRLKGQDFYTDDLLLTKLIEFAFYHEALIFCAHRRKRAPERTVYLCIAITALHAMGHPRMAKALVPQLSMCKNDPQDSDHVFKMALAVELYAPLLPWFEKHLVAHPYDTKAMQQAAYIALKAGNEKRALHLWQQILQLDKTDFETQQNIHLLHAGQVTGIVPHGMMSPRSVLCPQSHLMSIINSGAPLDAQAIEALQWAVIAGGDALGGPLMQLTKRMERTDAVILLRSWLLNSNGSGEIHRQSIYALIDLEEPGPYIMLHRGKLTYVNPQPMQQQEVQKDIRRNVFIMRCLFELRDIATSAETVALASRFFDSMPDRMRSDTLSPNAYAYCAALKIYHLSTTKRQNEIAPYLSASMLSKRRIKRAYRKLLKLKGETNHAIN